MSLHTNRRSHYGFAYFIFCYQTVQYDVIAFTHITNIHGGRGRLARVKKGLTAFIV